MSLGIALAFAFAFHLHDMLSLGFDTQTANRLLKFWVLIGWKVLSNFVTAALAQPCANMSAFLWQPIGILLYLIQNQWKESPVLDVFSNLTWIKMYDA